MLKPEIPGVSQLSDLLTPLAMDEGTQYVVTESLPLPGNPAMIKHLSVGFAAHTREQSLISVRADIPVPRNGLNVSWLMDGKSRLSTT
jgi:hypothetical protein